jgi:hypothetical protein
LFRISDLVFRVSCYWRVFWLRLYKAQYASRRTQHEQIGFVCTSKSACGEWVDEFMCKSVFLSSTLLPIYSSTLINWVCFFIFLLTGFTGFTKIDISVNPVILSNILSSADLHRFFLFTIHQSPTKDYRLNTNDYNSRYSLFPNRLSRRSGRSRTSHVFYPFLFLILYLFLFS